MTVNGQFIVVVTVVVAAVRRANERGVSVVVSKRLLGGGGKVRRGGGGGVAAQDCFRPRRRRARLECPGPEGCPKCGGGLEWSGGRHRRRRLILRNRWVSSIPGPLVANVAPTTSKERPTAVPPRRRTWRRHCGRGQRGNG